MLSVYINDIIEYLTSIEHFYQIDSQYMNRQLDIQEKMRQILVDWLVDVTVKFKFKS